MYSGLFYIQYQTDCDNAYNMSVLTFRTAIILFILSQSIALLPNLESFRSGIRQSPH
jgi:hypothetical protein